MQQRTWLLTLVVWSCFVAWVYFFYFSDYYSACLLIIKYALRWHLVDGWNNGDVLMDEMTSLIRNVSLKLGLSNKIVPTNGWERDKATIHLLINHIISHTPRHNTSLIQTSQTIACPFMTKNITLTRRRRTFHSNATRTNRASSPPLWCGSPTRQT